MSQVVRLPNNSYKPINNTTWVRAQLYKLQKGCTRFAAASDKVYQLVAHGQWFSPGTPASSTTKTGRHDIAEILLKVALSTINQIIISTFVVLTCILFLSYKRCSECANWSHVDKVIYWLDYLNRFCEIHTFYRMYIVHMFIVSTGKFAANMIVIYCCSYLVRP